MISICMGRLAIQQVLNMEISTHRDAPDRFVSDFANIRVEVCDEIEIHEVHDERGV